MGSYYGNILEEELKNKVAYDLFEGYDTTQIIGRVDFCVSVPGDPLGLNEPESLLWAEAKQGTKHDIYESFIQLILTLGKERPQDTLLPPSFLGAFDAEKIAFLPYSAILDVLHQNDFNWNVAPSDHKTKEFLQLYALLEDSLNHGLEIYQYERDSKELMHFIRHNFNLQKRKGESHIRINKNNFTHIYFKWLQAVKPTININWDVAQKAGILDADFYLADILSKENNTLREKLFVLLQDDHYLLDRQVNDLGLTDFMRAEFTDKQVAHTQFWNRYARPPRREYWDEIVNRRDLLVPPDVRERKGSFFTPARWVELSQQYIAAELGEDWQEHYFVWDCCAGTGNLLAGLQKKHNVYASTLDKADVQVMKQLNFLLDKHTFQFDFLNDPFFDVTDDKGNVVVKSKLPASLQDILRDPEKRKKLVIYINPPYAEASSGQGRRFKDKVQETNIYYKYGKELGNAKKELFAQFFIRIYNEIPTAMLAEFSKLKILQASNFRDFRKVFRAKPGRGFEVPANSFDNVKGNFPIAFMIWDLSIPEFFTQRINDVYDSKGCFLQQITRYTNDNVQRINTWLQSFPNDTPPIGYLMADAPDYQNNKYISIIQQPTQRHGIFFAISKNNLHIATIYLSVRLCIEATWLNDRDQFLFPNDGWQSDVEFQKNCLVYTLFHGQNRISSQHGTNHWIPFTEEEVNAQERFESHFMSDYLAGKIQPEAPQQGNLFEKAKEEAASAVLSDEAQAVMDAGRELWRYYHAQPNANPNASFYDIRLYFQGTKTLPSGKVQMNTESNDATYTTLITNLRQRMKELAKAIEPKVYEYGFLKQ